MLWLVFWSNYRVFLFGRRPAIFAACERLRRRQLKESLLLHDLKYFRSIINALYVVWQWRTLYKKWKAMKSAYFSKKRRRIFTCALVRDISLQVCEVKSRITGISSSFKVNYSVFAFLKIFIIWWNVALSSKFFKPKWPFIYEVCGLLISNTFHLAFVNSKQNKHVQTLIEWSIIFLTPMFLTVLVKTELGTTYSHQAKA